jgi:hypothetical protein
MTESISRIGVVRGTRAMMNARWTGKSALKAAA